MNVPERWRITIIGYQSATAEALETHRTFLARKWRMRNAKV